MSPVIFFFLFAHDVTLPGIYCLNYVIFDVIFDIFCSAMIPGYQHGPYIRVIYTARTYGPYIRVVCTGLYYRVLSPELIFGVQAAIHLAIGCHYFCQACGYFPSQRASLPTSRYHIIVLSDKRHVCELGLEQILVLILNHIRSSVD